MHLRVVSFNVWNNDGDERRTGFINKEIKKLNPDLIAFQEVMFPGEKSSGQNQLNKLTADMKFYSTHQMEIMPYKPSGIDKYGGTAIATRWPHKIVEILDLRTTGEMDVPWCTLAAVVNIPDEGELLFIAPTLSWRLNAEAAREQQVTLLSDLDARHRRKLPTIIAGDFNAPPEAACIQYLSGLRSLNNRSVHYNDAWLIAGEGAGYTWTYENPNAKKVMDQIIAQPNYHRRIDYVFIGSRHVHPEAECRVTGAKLALNKPVDGIWLSDHFGVVVDLDISKNP